MNNENSRRTRRNWGRNETIAFLECYLHRKAEFETPRKRRSAFQNVLEDLVSMDILEGETTVDMLEQRMKTLLRAYKSSRDNENQTGASPCVAPYMKEMEEIFGDRAIISNSHTLSVGVSPVVLSTGKPLFSSAEEEVKPKSPHLATITTLQMKPSAGPSTSSFAREKEGSQRPASTQQESSSASVGEERSDGRKKRVTPKSSYYRKK